MFIIIYTANPVPQNDLLQLLQVLRPYRSMPYSRQIQPTAFGGRSCWRGLAPSAESISLLSLSQRRKVLWLTPASAASSYLYALFVIASVPFVSHLQRYDFFLYFARNSLTFFERKRPKTANNGQRRPKTDNAPQRCRTFVLPFGTRHA